MDPFIRTQSGTIIGDGIEYSTYTPPTAIVKVMERCWAEQLVAIGSMHFGNLECYRQWENAVLGDPNDGEGMFRMKGHPYTVGSSNKIYAWCTALPGIAIERIHVLARYGGYDCMVRIHKPAVLIQRVRSALLMKYPKLLIHCAEVSYSRGTEVDKATLNSQKFQFNVFQKDQRFAEDKEYRLSLTDVRVKSAFRDYIDVQVGDCSDIMDIENLPSKGVDLTSNPLRVI